VEIAKPRLADPAERQTTQCVLAHALDVMVRLLHPLLPFLTEEIWQTLAQFAPQRGLQAPEKASEHLIKAAWPVADATLIDVEIEQQFALFQATIGAIREIRSRQNIPPREEVPFAVRCSKQAQQLLAPMATYFAAMANAKAVAWGPDITSPETSAHVALPKLELDVYVDLEQFIDVAAELERNNKLLERLTKQITGKQQKLGNENFVSRAPADVVAKEQASLQELIEQVAGVKMAIQSLEAKL